MKRGPSLRTQRIRLTRAIRPGMRSPTGNIQAPPRVHLGPKRLRTGAWKEAVSRFLLGPEPRSEASCRHFAGPTARALRTPWRFKSSHPHRQIGRLQCPISAQTVWLLPPAYPVDDVVFRRR
jgi:hypothetical protein